ncbi:MAG: Rieske 2Fe-2S domain-containing protein [Sinobacteraceae bacterium]|nr:Rieske 2Fe-2S domain-containing protein [Nevskiaceae bacterium]
MYINFWYPVARSQDLGRTPLKVRILAHDLVAFRDQAGHAAVLSDTCAHRGASLSAGKCKEDGTVQCPYHGWRFDTRGVCTRIPSIGSKTRPPPRARVDAYPVEERYGIVFAFLGDLPEASRPPIMAVNERNAYIASQDIRVMNTVQPRLTPPSRTKELMMPADRCILQYRDKLDEFRRQGWKLDLPAIQAARARGDTIFAIPCPARRVTRAWVLDEAPRLAPASSETSAVLQVAG